MDDRLRRCPLVPSLIISVFSVTIDASRTYSDTTLGYRGGSSYWIVVVGHSWAGLTSTGRTSRIG